MCPEFVNVFFIFFSTNYYVISLVLTFLAVVFTFPGWQREREENKEEGMKRFNAHTNLGARTGVLF